MEKLKQMAAVLLMLTASTVKTIGQTQAPLTVKNQLIIDSQGNGSGLKFTGLNSSTSVSTVPAKVLTLDTDGNVLMGNMPTIPTIPVGATVWDLSNNVASTAAGSVVIGTGVTIPANNPYSLYVSKGILTEKMRVAVGGSSFWADYVFDKKYQLPTLSKVEKFINENKHLPDVPSAEEVSKNGIDFVEMQATLLRKIEELTLYTIKQEKELKKLKREINYLKKK
ncbi:hypothetical protein LV89_03364 [Arcicella aurantiaca]|uniref:BZIP transcription factor n=1 Tax=Arcicella aurantiaca TaxID=591202 RepID=A0A316DZC6_9BACT|nr:hypothetical protein [Arcicella aurantiaca]PWK22652.1 hypothetical protein LV89_03364 [Arcicella aurantiaca]